MGDVLSNAISMARQGVRLFPVANDAKIPAIEKFSERATADETKLAEYFGTDFYNSGIACGYVAPGMYLVAIDVDFKDERDGYATVERLAVEGKVFPETWSQKTGNGGEHLLYWSPVPLRQGTDVLGVGIDTRADGGYIVGPGSTVQGRVYSSGDINAAIAPAPEWLIGDLKKEQALVRRIDGASGIPVQNQILALRRSAEYLASLEVATKGNRNGLCYKAACYLRDLGLAEEQAPDVLVQLWKCTPPLERSEIEQCVVSAWKYAQNTPGNLAPENLFDSSVSGEGFDPKHPVMIFNETHFVVKEGSDTSVYEKRFSPETNKTLYTRVSFEGMDKWYANHMVHVGDKDIPIFKAWVRDARRRQYEGIVFDPSGKTPANYFNIWQGYGIDPKPGSWEKIREFMLSILCDNDDALFRYLLGWMANMFQRPSEPGQVALVFKGEKGVGKSTLADFLADIFGNHGMQFSQSSQLTGRFLSHLRQLVFVAANESFWSGDQAAEGTLKNLITDKIITVEEKFKEPVSVKNMIHLIFTTNSDWAVPASLRDERRFAVFDVSPRRMQDRKYFTELRKEAYQDGGLAAMLDFLLGYDLSEFDVTKVPHTKGLVEQKLRSLRGPERWMLECLSVGKLGVAEWPETEWVQVDRADLYRDYCDWSRGHEYSPIGPIWFGRALRKILTEGIACPHRPFKHKRQWRFAPLVAARARFISHNKLGNIDWSRDFDGDDLEDPEFDGTVIEDLL